MINPANLPDDHTPPLLSGCHFGGASGGATPAGTTQSTQTSTPWSEQAKYLAGSDPSAGGAAPGVFQSAADLYKNYTPQYFPDWTIAPLDPFQLASIQGTADYAQSGGLADPSMGAATDILSGARSGANPTLGNLAPIASGSMLGAQNPYFKQMADSVLEQVVPGLEAQFNQGNSLNNPGVARAVGQGAADAVGKLAYADYGASQDRMLAANKIAGDTYSTGSSDILKALALAPQTNSLPYQNFAAMNQAGTQLQTQGQGELNDLIARFQFGQQLPYEQLAKYAQMVQGGYGSSSTLEQPYFQNKTGTALGTALGGATIGSMVGGPMGAGVGGGLGLLASLALG